MVNSDAQLAAATAIVHSVLDPEIPVITLADLGVIREVRCVVNDANAAVPTIHVVMTPTYVGCPAVSQMQSDIKDALAAAGFGCEVSTQLSPPWSTDWMSHAAREKLRSYGIAPPAHLVHDASTSSAYADQASTTPATHVIQWQAQRAPAKHTPNCPHCGSDAVEKLAQFASTACKALYRCTICLEPFDYFKPY